MPKARLPKRLGKEWSESELRQFFESYLKHFKSSQLQRSFIRIANTLPDRTASNVKTLYKMNRSFLSLPHIGVDTFVAIMVDRYLAITLTLTHSQSLTHTHTRTGTHSATIPTRTHRWDLPHQEVHRRRNDTDRVQVRAAHLTAHRPDEERDSSSPRRAHRVRDSLFRVRNSIKDTVRPLRQENLPWSQAK